MPKVIIVRRLTKASYEKLQKLGVTVIFKTGYLPKTV